MPSPTVLTDRPNRPQRKSVEPGYGAFAITKSDVTVLDPMPREVYVTGAGDISFVGADGETDTWTVPANFYIPVRMQKVLATGTTATGIHGIY